VKPLRDGDYVLATKWSDGDPCDHFVIGYFKEMLDDRFLVEDGDGNLFRANGFRRCERISKRVGHALVKAFPLISDKPGRSLWYWRRHIKTLEEGTR
jgi:hypothetical protein